VDQLIDLVDYQKAKDICITQSVKAIDGVLNAQAVREERMFYAFPPDGEESLFEEGGYALMISSQLTVKVINDHLNDYNESHAVMSLILFKDVMEHVSGIARGITTPGGTYCLLVWADQGNNHWFVWQRLLPGTHATNCGRCWHFCDVGRVSSGMTPADELPAYCAVRPD
jgi:hypothetical protein